MEWLGTAEGNIRSDCSEFFITMYRIHHFNRAAKGRLINSFSKLAMKEINIVEFKDHIKVHPIFSGLHLDRYQVTGFCKKNEDGLIETIFVKLPAFKAINIL